YVAIDPLGKERTGVLEGDTPRQVRGLLRDRDLIPVEVTEVEGKRAASSQRYSLSRGLSALDLALMTRQLATLSRAGLPLEEALQAVSEQSEKARLKSILLGVRAKVLEGHTLATGLEDFPSAFPLVYRATVSAGEQAGRLDTVLERLAEYTEARHSLRQKVSHAMIYPIVLTGLAITIITLMLVYVVPKVVGVFESTGQTLPLLTRWLIAMSGFLQNYWWLLIAGIVIGVLGARRLFRQEAPRRALHRRLLHLPLIGRVTRGLNT
ncbi:MAG: type II secretion system protein GspF, partial [Gammaproteobacteria bacterium]|nr:type II secretion system protein GspF [Gammaproteobacteria bacterium]